MMQFFDWLETCPLWLFVLVALGVWAGILATALLWAVLRVAGRE